MFVGQNSTKNSTRKTVGPIAVRIATLLASLGWSLAGVSNARAQDATPFVAYISERGCQMHCGPGKQYYTTGVLLPGVEVRVYRRAPGGWLGIRPTDDSFCWVPNDDLRVATDQRTAKVVRDGVVAWIAAAGGHAPNRWQVRLQIGEAVRIHGPPEKLPLNGQAARWWRRIAAPAGEFRWIRESALADPLGRVVVKSEPTEKRAAIQTVSHETGAATQAAAREPNAFDPPEGDPKSLSALTEPAKRAENEPRTPEQRASNGEADIEIVERAAKRLEAAFDQLDALVRPAQFGTWRRRGEAAETASSPLEDEAVRKPREVRFRDRSQTPAGSAEGLEPSASARQAALGGEPQLWGGPLLQREFHHELIQLDADLSLMVAKPLKYWRLSELKRRAVELSQRGPTPLDRGRAALLLDSIHGFDQLYVRRIAADDDAEEERRFSEQDDAAERDNRRNADESRSSTGGASETTNKDPMRIREPTGSGVRRPAQLGIPKPDSRGGPDQQDRTAGEPSPFDAQGVLKRVTSERRIAPPYALVDDHGNIVTLIAPAPGLNLQTYLGKSIGVFGPQRQLPSFRRGLLTAQRVVQMDRIR